MPVNERVGWGLIKTHFPEGAQNFKTLAKPLSVMSLRLIVSKDYPNSKKLFDRFNKTLEKCVENGLIKTENCE